MHEVCHPDENVEGRQSMHELDVASANLPGTQYEQVVRPGKCAV